MTFVEVLRTIRNVSFSAQTLYMRRDTLMTTNCLFKYFNRNEVGPRSINDTPLHRSGYGANQMAFREMARGYKEGADTIVATQKNNNCDFKNELLYPIFFCYRQSFELILKAIICNCSIPYNMNIDDEAKKELVKDLNGHKLLCLFKKISKRIDEKRLFDNYSDLLNDILPYIQAFDEFDGSSFEMRYATDTKFIPVDCQKDLMAYDVHYTSEHYNCVWNMLMTLYSKTEKDWIYGLFEI